MLKFFQSSRLLGALLAVVILLIFLHYGGIIRPAENLIIRFLAPIQRQFYAAGTAINNLYVNVTSRQDQAEENQRLSDEVKRLTVANADLKTKLEESQDLLTQYNFLVKNNLTALPAKIIGQSPEPNRQTIILDKGAKDGVAPGLAVVAGAGVIVGKIFAVKNYSADVILINDHRSRLAAVVQNASQSQGVVSGEHGLSLKMELIPQNENIQKDEVVVTSGLEAAIPKGLVIGKISRVAAEPNSFFQTAWIQPLIKFDSLNVVSILKDSNND